jgi:signal transduction histidine kinase
MPSTSSQVGASRYATFGGDAQLLAELGERLIATPRLALAELVKNSFDADATQVYVWLSNDPSPVLHVQDDGHGMSEGEFLSSWMRIGTTAKLRAPRTSRFKRPMTGSKGVGRFAVRRLGRSLRLESIAKTENRKAVEKTDARFDWNDFQPGKDLGSVRIPYEVGRATEGTPTGTHLTIGDLLDEWDNDGLLSVTGEVLDIVSPGLPGWITKHQEKDDRDPGLALFIGSPEAPNRMMSATSEIVNRWLARVQVEVVGEEVRYRCAYRDLDTGQTRSTQRWHAKLPGDANLIGPVRAEIRYFPHRSGVFSGMGTADGRRAHSYIQEHSGIRVIDRGVRLPPYGDEEDDWLNLTARVSKNVRGWLSPITESIYPAESQLREGRYSAFLRVPANHQLVGWTLVESSREVKVEGSAKGPPLLQQRMDRQGLVDNGALEQLKLVLIAAAELVAIVDTEQTRAIDKETAQSEAREVRTKLAGAASRIESSTTIPRREKEILLKSLSSVSDQLTRSEEARSQAIEAVESVSLLGVLAGFMVHETQTLLDSVREAIDALEGVGKSSPGAALDQARSSLVESKVRLEAFMDYAEYFFKGLPASKVEPFEPRAHVETITDLFSDLTSKRHVAVENAVPSDLPSPKVWVGLYTGVVLNLLTNSLKAVFPLRQSDGKRILIEASRVEGGHLLRVSDTGVGVPPEIRDYIFDPFVSTTRAVAGPLGGGLGLGLYIVRRALKAVGGRIRLVDPPEGFTTTFEVTFPE